MLFMAFQGTFCIITAALISGAIVERMRFSAYVRVHLALGARRLRADRALGVGRRLAGEDGRARLRRRHRRARERGASRRSSPRIVVGKRRDYRVVVARCRTTCRSSLLGAGLLWFGWFGFNAGSALAASPHRRPRVRRRRCSRRRRRWWSGRSSMSMRSGKPTAVGAATAIVVGLVAMTPAAGFVSPMSAIALGGIAAVPSYFALQLAREDVARRFARRRRGARRRRHGRRAADRRVRGEGAQRRRRRRCSMAIPVSC